MDDDHAALAALTQATRAVIGGRPASVAGAALNPPVVLSSTYVAADGETRPGSATYGRWDNATWEAFEAALAGLEGGQALLFGSGMGAISAVLAEVPDGGVLVLPRDAYSGTLGLVAALQARGRLVARHVDIDDTSTVLAALDGAQLLWVETPTNPMLKIADLPALVAGAKARSASGPRILVAVDNTFCTPIVSQPLALGADVVVHSVTKYLSGHSDVVLGAAVSADPALHARLLTHRTQNGAIPGPFEAWLALRGLRTLDVRVERAGANAVELARRLSGHRAVERVRHPSLPDDPGRGRAVAQMRGFGAVIAVEVRGGAEAAERVASSVRLWVHATSLGGVESTLERRRRHSAEAHVVPENLLRLSVGLEDVEDLWHDLAAALDQL